MAMGNHRKLHALNGRLNVTIPSMGQSLPWQSLQHTALQISGASTPWSFIRFFVFQMFFFKSMVLDPLLKPTIETMKLLKPTIKKNYYYCNGRYMSLAWRHEGGRWCWWRCAFVGCSRGSGAERGYSQLIGGKHPITYRVSAIQDMV